MSHSRPRIFDIGANLSDLVFQGIYHGRKVHVSDLTAVLDRARSVGVEKIMVTAGCLQDIQDITSFSSQLSLEYQSMLCTTVGVHPTRANEFESCEGGPDAYMKELLKILRSRNTSKLPISAIGEFGLDYDRLEYSNCEQQCKYFERQFELVEETQLPLFLHMRNAANDFIEIVKRNREKFKDGVVHSFTGTLEEAKQLLDLDLYIGINGCSLKTAENLEVIKNIPIDRLMVESDAPWCEIRPSSPAHSLIATRFKAFAKEKFQMGQSVKSRNEPFAARQVLEVISALSGIPLDDLAAKVYANSIKILS